MTVSLPVMVTVAGGEEAEVMPGPCVLTDLIVTEVTGGGPALVVVTGAEDARSIMTLCVAAGQSVLWHGKLVMGAGIAVGSQMGSVAVTVGYY